MPEGMPLPITTYIPPDYVPQGMSAGSESTQFAGGPEFTEYRFNQHNFVKVVKNQKWFQKQLEKWAGDFKPFVDEIVAKAVRPFQNIQVRMDNMEVHINKRLDSLSLPDLGKLMVEFEQAKADIVELKEKQS